LETIFPANHLTGTSKTKYKQQSNDNTKKPKQQLMKTTDTRKAEAKPNKTKACFSSLDNGSGLFYTTAPSKFAFSILAKLSMTMSLTDVGSIS